MKLTKSKLFALSIIILFMFLLYIFWNRKIVVEGQTGGERSYNGVRYDVSYGKKIFGIQIPTVRFIHNSGTPPQDINNIDALNRQFSENMNRLNKLHEDVLKTQKCFYGYIDNGIVLGNVKIGPSGFIEIVDKPTTGVKCHPALQVMNIQLPKGVIGPRGRQGPAGIQGPKGKKGPRGKQGIKGTAACIKNIDKPFADNTARNPIVSTIHS